MKYNDKLNIAAIRATIIDGTNKANSGHPGMAIGSAPMLYTLYTRHLVSDPTNPNWINRDRFVLSAGHASMLLYTMLHFCGYGISLKDLQEFRQLNSITPGHPEFGMTPGVDATTGPLGQGIASAVGLALGEKHLAKTVDNKAIIDHYTYCLIGDGCLQEGISQEAISFAGLQKLNKLIVLYDSNAITLDGPLTNSYNEDVKGRFNAAQWNVLTVKDGNNVKAIDKAITKAKKSKDKPTLIIVNTIIGQGSKLQGSHKVHGNPLGKEDGQYAKESYNYQYGEWQLPGDLYDVYIDTFINRGKAAYQAWEVNVNSIKNSNKFIYEQLTNQEEFDLKNTNSVATPTFIDGSNEATRKSSGNTLALFNKALPNLLGGSADVASSVMTAIKGEVDLTANNPSGRNINFGIREFAMAAIQNGLLLHGGLRTYIGSFLVFSDYMKNAVRLAALSHLPAIYLFSHDSVALGEDGPTHQPIEHLAMLRSLPNLNVWRPADSVETFVAWKHALLSTKTPNALILSRQNLPIVAKDKEEEIAKGGYVLSQTSAKVDFTIIATGSEVSLALEAKKLLEKDGLSIKVVSMPSFEVFENQDLAYKNKVLGNDINKRISVELLSTFGWSKYAKHNLGIDHFGYSAPMKDIINHLNFTPTRLANDIKAILKQ